MSRLEEVNRKIEAKLRELRTDRKEREEAHQIIQRRETRLEDLRDELHKARKRVQRRRDALIELGEELRDANEGTPDSTTAQEVRLQRRLDELSGEFEDAVALRDRILDRIDRMVEKLDPAKDKLKEIVGDVQDDLEALERLRRKRKRIKERQDRPSPHFAYAEFDCNDGTHLPKESEPAVKDWCIRIGEPLRKQFGPLHINSGFRHAAYNARIGGEPASVHIYNYPGRDYRAVAVDFRCGKGTPRSWYDFTAGKADGRGLYATFHHADTRNRIGWSDATWTG